MRSSTLRTTVGVLGAMFCFFGGLLFDKSVTVGIILMGLGWCFAYTAVETETL